MSRPKTVAVPLVVYVAIFFSEHGQLNITDSSGLFLWSRTMSFANCAVIKPPPSLVPLCPENQPDHPAGLTPAWSVPATAMSGVRIQTVFG